MTAPTTTIRVMIVEDDAITRQRFAHAIGSAPDLTLVAAFESGREALRWLEREGVDVLLTDLGLPDVPGLGVIAYCAQRHPDAQIMVITMYEDETHVLRSLQAGARGYLLKDALNDEIVERIHELAAGGAPMTPPIARLVLNRLYPRPAAPAPTLTAASFDPLTERERQVLTRIAQGFSYAEIADLEGISRHTVHTHIKSIYGKLQVHSKSEAVFEAGRLGLIDVTLRA